MISFYLHSYGQHDAHHHIGPCTWPHYDLLFVHEGDVFLTLMKRHELRLSSGQGILIYPLTHFEGYSITEISKTSVQHFDIDADVANLPRVIQQVAGKTHGYELFKGGYSERLWQNIELAIRWKSYDNDPVIHDLRVANFTLILGELKTHAFQVKTQDIHALAIEELVRELRENVQRRIPSLDEMAHQLGFSTSHFRALFKKHVGVSPGRFLKDLRTLEAKRCLQETVLPIKEISDRLGFANLSHFYRAFKTEVGATPSQYRKQYIIRG